MKYNGTSLHWFCQISEVNYSFANLYAFIFFCMHYKQSQEQPWKISLDACCFLFAAISALLLRDLPLI